MSKRNTTIDYQRGLKWGKKQIAKEYKKDGERALYRCDKAARTCMKYANDPRVTKTSNGVPLTAKLRQYYRGIADGMLEGYNKL